MNNETLCKVVRFTYAMEIISLWVLAIIILPVILLFNISVMLWLWITSKSLKDSIIIVIKAWRVRLIRFCYLSKTELDKTLKKEG